MRFIKLMTVAGILMIGPSTVDAQNVRLKVKKHKVERKSHLPIKTAVKQVQLSDVAVKNAVKKARKRRMRRIRGNANRVVLPTTEPQKE